MKFTIRNLFLVTVIVAVCVAWWLDGSRIREEVRRVNIDKAAAEKDAANTRAWLLIPEVQEAMVKSLGGAYSVPPTSQAPAPNPTKP